MITLTPQAKKMLDDYFSTQLSVSPVRIFVAPGWGGPRLGLALDEPTETDDVFEIQGYKFVIDKSLLQTAAPIEIDASPYGFKLSSKLKGSGGDCSSCTSC